MFSFLFVIPMCHFVPKFQKFNLSNSDSEYCSLAMLHLNMSKVMTSPEALSLFNYKMNFHSHEEAKNSINNDKSFHNCLLYKQVKLSHICY